MEIIVLLILLCIFFIVREMNSKQSLKSEDILRQENRILDRILTSRMKLGGPGGNSDEEADPLGLDPGADIDLAAVAPSRSNPSSVSSECLLSPTAEREDPVHPVEEDGQGGTLVTVFTSGAVDLTRGGRAAWCAYVRSQGAMSEPGGIVKTKVANALHAEVAAAAEGIKHAIDKLAMKSGDTILLQSSSEYALQVLTGTTPVTPDAPEAGIVFHVIDLLQTQGITLRVRHRADGKGDRGRRDRALQLVEARVQEMLLKRRTGGAASRVKAWDADDGVDAAGDGGSPQISRVDPLDDGLGTTPARIQRQQSPMPLAGLTPPPLPADAYPWLAAANTQAAGAPPRKPRAARAVGTTTRPGA